MKIRISGVVAESFSDGPGIRLVVFAQGCPHRCPGCHNSQTHPFEGGRLVDVRDILSEMAANPLLDGITLSGGEPFEQAEAFGALAEEVGARGGNIVTYTGYEYEEVLKRSRSLRGWRRLLYATDILVDGRFEMELKDELLQFRGSSNQRLIDVARSLKCGQAVEYALQGDRFCDVREKGTLPTQRADSFPG